jgi:hypothetical protein
MKLSELFFEMVTRANLHLPKGMSMIGVELDDYPEDIKLPIQNVDINKIVNLEPESKVKGRTSSVQVTAMVEDLMRGEKLPPLIIQKVNTKNQLPLGGTVNKKYEYQVLDGHHRYAAYKTYMKEKGTTTMRVPCKVIDSKHVRAMKREDVK